MTLQRARESSCICKFLGDLYPEPWEIKIAGVTDMSLGSFKWKCFAERIKMSSYKLSGKLNYSGLFKISGETLETSLSVSLFKTAMDIGRCRKDRTLAITARAEARICGRPHSKPVAHGNHKEVGGVTQCFSKPSCFASYLVTIFLSVQVILFHL